ncbi:DUF1330 domain-containing protein [uncultured Pseudomonas sp.]|uniref:DUF1330 domain-containing protein n=1 Tax=uncultured Pseudomonas sp. TaxID=114707 RepID=UPI0025FC64E4|nr:DUF1330 domain-containing protein [uncultured Pseudomonas sp.]
MKGYWIAQVDVTDPDAYRGYTDRAPAAFARYGGRFLARGGRAEQLEGDGWATRRVVIEFDSYEQALACYRSAEYQEACGHRQSAARAEIFIVEGV